MCCKHVDLTELCWRYNVCTALCINVVPSFSSLAYLSVARGVGYAHVRIVVSWNSIHNTVEQAAVHACDRDLAFDQELQCSPHACALDMSNGLLSFVFVGQQINVHRMWKRKLYRPIESTVCSRFYWKSVLVLSCKIGVISGIIIIIIEFIVSRTT